MNPWVSPPRRQTNVPLMIVGIVTAMIVGVIIIGIALSSRSHPAAPARSDTYYQCIATYGPGLDSLDPTSWPSLPAGSPCKQFEHA